MKCEILYISPMKMTAQTFQKRIGILCISYENLCAGFPAWDCEFYVLHIWKTRCYLFSMNCAILHISLINIWPLILGHKRWNFYFVHICKLVHWFSSIKYRISDYSLLIIAMKRKDSLLGRKDKTNLDTMCWETEISLCQKKSM